MFKRIKRIKRLDCVQEGGFRHFVAHLIGNISPSRCGMLIGRRWGRGFVEGFTEGIEKVQVQEETNIETCYKEELEKLRARIGDKGGLVAEMKGLKPQLAIRELKALNNLSDEDMKKYLKLQKKKEKLQRKQLLEGVPPEYRTEIEKRLFGK